MLLFKLGKNHLSSVITELKYLTECWQTDILEYIDGNQLKSMINTFDKLNITLAWCSENVKFDKCATGNPQYYCYKLLKILGQHHLMSLIPTGKELVGLLDDKPVKYNHNNSSRIDTKTLLSFIGNKLADFKNSIIYDLPFSLEEMADALQLDPSLIHHVDINKGNSGITLKFKSSFREHAKLQLVAERLSGHDIENVFCGSLQAPTAESSCCKSFTYE